MPFGTIEAPDGVVVPLPRDEPMSVFGFRDVWDAAHHVTLANGHIARIPTIPGYTVLKLRAWADRSPIGQYKDAADLACAMHWYMESEEVRDRLYDPEQESDALIETEFDTPLAAVRLLVEDACSLLAPPRRAELRDAWQPVDDARLADHLHETALQGWPRRGDHRLLARAMAIRSVLNRQTGATSAQ